MATAVDELTEKQKQNHKKVTVVLGWLKENAHIRSIGKMTLIAKKANPIKSLDDVQVVGSRALAVWYGNAKRHEAKHVCSFDEAMAAAWPAGSDTEEAGE